MRWFINSIKNDDFKELPVVIDRLKKWLLRPNGLFIGDIIYIPVQNGFDRKKITKKFYNWKEGVWFVSLDDNGKPMDIPYDSAVEIRQRYYKRKINESISYFNNNLIKKD